MRIKLGNDYEKKQNSPFCHHHREILVVISAFFWGEGVHLYIQERYSIYTVAL